jgi:hypothetical protein
MRKLSVLSLFTAFILASCAHKPESAIKTTPGMTRATSSNSAATLMATAATTNSALTVTPSVGLTGKVARYNDAGRFVVLEFPVGRLPTLEQQLFVYRNDLKVGEVKVTAWQKDVYVVADLTTGEARAGDEVRDK